FRRANPLRREGTTIRRSTCARRGADGTSTRTSRFPMGTKVVDRLHAAESKSLLDSRIVLWDCAIKHLRSVSFAFTAANERDVSPPIWVNRCFSAARTKPL